MNKPNPTEVMLNNLMKNPGKTFLLKKPKDQRHKKIHNKERRQTILEVETSLKLLGIPYWKIGEFKIALIKDVENG